MKAEVIMPKVDMDQENGTLVEWLKQEGETVKKGEPLFVILTSKATIEIEAPESGILRGITAKKDDVIPVTEVIAYIVSPDEKFEVFETKAAETTNVAKTITVAPEKMEASGISHNPVMVAGDASQVRATPLARAIAREKGLDLSIVPGRGPRGRIYKADILSALEKSGGISPTKPAIIQEKVGNIPSVQINLPNARIRERIPMKGIRTVISAAQGLQLEFYPTYLLGLLMKLWKK